MSTELPQADLIREIDDFLARTGMSASSLGRDALGDPAFVTTLRSGRDCRSKTVRKVRAFMASAPDGDGGGATEASS